MGSLTAPYSLPLSLPMGQWIPNITLVITCAMGLHTASDISRPRTPPPPPQYPLIGRETRLGAAGARAGKVRGTGVGQWAQLAQLAGGRALLPPPSLLRFVI